MAHYSRAVVVARADAATKASTEAAEEMRKLRAELAEDRKKGDARLLRVAQFVLNRTAAAERLANANFRARLRWFLRGTVPAPEKSLEELVHEAAPPARSQFPNRNSQRPADQETAAASGTAPHGRPAAGQPAAREPDDEEASGS